MNDTPAGIFDIDTADSEYLASRLGMHESAITCSRRRATRSPFSSVASPQAATTVACWHSASMKMLNVFDQLSRASTAWQGAKVHPFPWTVKEEGLRRYAKVLYLSPLLERRALDVVVAIVAHELAHIFLRHTPYPDVAG